MEAGIACNVVRRLAEHSAHVAAACEAAAELDCLLSLALAARQLNLSRPTVRSCCGRSSLGLGGGARL
jgi:DNA mismatch repair ATPase MutS